MINKLKTLLKWVFVAIVLLVLGRWLMGLLGWHDVRGFRPEGHPHPGMAPGGFGMHGQAHFMRHQPSMFFHSIWWIVTVVFWAAVAVILYKWWTKRSKPSSVSQMLMEAPVAYPIEQTDFLDEWEKSVHMKKEEHDHGDLETDQKHDGR